MSKRSVSFIIVLLVLLQASFSLAGQKPATGSYRKKVYTIPFLLTEYNNISIQAILNGSDTVHLMFHTAANAVAITAETIKRLNSIRFNDSTTTVKSWGSSSNSSRLSAINRLQIGELSWDSVEVWEDINSGQHTDGKFGINLFAGKIVEIDFDQQVIRLHTSLPKKARKYQQLRVENNDDLLFINGVCNTGDSLLTHSFLVHSGYSGAILFDDVFASTHRLGEKLTITGEKSLTDSYGHVIRTRQAILPELQLQQLLLKNIPAGFFEGLVGRQRMSVIGGDVLKRFNWIIDLETDKIYLHRNRFYAAPYSGY